MIAKAADKTLEKEGTANTALGLAEFLPYFDELMIKVQGVQVRGLTVKPSNQGSGWLSILRVTVEGFADSQAHLLGYAQGDYVIYGFGEDLWEAIANIETRLRLGTAAMTPDKYGDVPGVTQPHAKSARKTRR